MSSQSAVAIPSSPSPREVAWLSRSRISRVRWSARLLARSRAACCLLARVQVRVAQRQAGQLAEHVQPDLVGLRSFFCAPATRAPA